MPYVNVSIPQDAKIGYCFVSSQEKTPSAEIVVIEGLTWHEEDLVNPALPIPVYTDTDSACFHKKCNCSCLAIVRFWGAKNGWAEYIHFDSIIDLRMISSMHTGYNIGVQLYSDSLDTIEYLMDALEERDTRATTVVDNEGVSRPGTCFYCGARLYLGEKHREEVEGQPACPILKFPITPTEEKNEPENETHDS